MSLLILSFEYYHKIGSKRMYLSDKIADHMIWQLEEFWIGSITVSIFEQMIKMDELEIGQNESLEDTLDREKKSIFG